MIVHTTYGFSLDVYNINIMLDITQSKTLISSVYLHEKSKSQFILDIIV